MSKRTKVILIVVAVVLVGLFAASVANQRRSGSGDSRSSNGFVDFLGDRAGAANAVADGDIQTSCRVAASRFEVKGGACALNVAAGGTGLRNLVLRTNKAMTVTSQVPRKDITVTDEIAAGEEVRVAIDERGGAVVLTCAPLTTCVVVLGNGA